MTLRAGGHSYPVPTMQIFYPDKFAVSDHGAVTLGIVIHQGDDYAEKWAFVSRHLQADGTFTRVPIDLAGVVFDSEIHDGTGKLVGSLTLLDDGAPGVLAVQLRGSTTAQLPVGTYTYWVKGADALAGVGRTYVSGNLEIRRK